MLRGKEIRGDQAFIRLKADEKTIIEVLPLELNKRMEIENFQIHKLEIKEWFLSVYILHISYILNNKKIDLSFFKGKLIPTVGTMPIIFKPGPNALFMKAVPAW